MRNQIWEKEHGINNESKTQVASVFKQSLGGIEVLACRGKITEMFDDGLDGGCGKFWRCGWKNGDLGDLGEGYAEHYVVVNLREEFMDEFEPEKLEKRVKYPITLVFEHVQVKPQRDVGNCLKQ